MSAAMTTPMLAHLWLWRPDLGRWMHCGTGTDTEMRAAEAATINAAAASGLPTDLTYCVAIEEPAPLHPARVVRVELPAPSSTSEHGSTWLGGTADGQDVWLVEDQGGLLTVEPPDFEDALRGIYRDAWRAFALAVLAATQPRTGGTR